METSAKLKVNIEETFALIVRRVMEARNAPENQQLVASNPEKREVQMEMVVEKRRRVGSDCCKCCIIC